MAWTCQCGHENVLRELCAKCGAWKPDLAPKRAPKVCHCDGATWTLGAPLVCDRCGGVCNLNETRGRDQALVDD